MYYNLEPSIIVFNSLQINENTNVYFTHLLHTFYF